MAVVARRSTRPRGARRSRPTGRRSARSQEPRRRSAGRTAARRRRVCAQERARRLGLLRDPSRPGEAIDRRPVQLGRPGSPQRASRTRPPVGRPTIAGVPATPGSPPARKRGGIGQDPACAASFLMLHWRPESHVAGDHRRCGAQTAAPRAPVRRARSTPITSPAVRRADCNRRMRLTGRGSGGCCRPRIAVVVPGHQRPGDGRPQRHCASSSAATPAGLPPTLRGPVLRAATAGITAWGWRDAAGTSGPIGSMPASARKLRRNSQTSVPSWLSPRVSIVTTPVPGREVDGRASSTVLSP
jgi:hypothetical protein